MKFIKSLLFIFILQLICENYSHANSDTIEEVNLSPYVEILDSKYNSLKVEELDKQEQWSNAYSELGKAKMEYAGNWYKLKIGSWVTNGNWILVHPLAAHFNLYRKFGNQYKSYEHGFKDFNLHRIVYRKTAILLDSIQIGETLYFKVVGMSKRSSHHPLIQSPNQFLKTVTHESPINFFFYSMILIVALISLFALFMLKEKIYFNYSLYLFSHIGVFFGIQGYAFQYFSNWSPAYSISFFGLVNFFIIMFVRELFEVKSKFQSRVTLFISIVSFLFSAVSLFGYINLAFEGLYSIVIATQFFIIGLCLINAFLHQDNRLILIFISLSFFISSLGLINDRIYIPYSDIIDAAYQPIALVEILLFGFMLLRRFYFINVERKRAIELARLKSIETLKLESENQKLLIDAKIGLLAGQVSHDIRSPLSALNMILTQLETIPEDKRILIRTSVNRINDISNDLLKHSKIQNNGSQDIALNPKESPQVTQLELTLMASLVDSVVSEKRISLREKTNVQIEAKLENSYGLFTKINPVEMKRLLSNTIGNSVEAFDSNSGLVEVIVETTLSNSNYIQLRIKDNGKGIPPHILEKLGQRGVTHGKEGTENGSGLGVYHAKKSIESFGGSYKIESTVGVGTSIIITLKKENPPSWFVNKLSISENQFIVATDDDNSVLEVWKQRFANLVDNENVKLVTCTSQKCLKEWVSENQSVVSKSLFLIDYEFLGHKYYGLDLVEELNINNQSILVSSRYEEINVKSRCEKLGVKMIPKGMASLVPIVIEKKSKILEYPS